ncbi:hypothetical protein ACFPTO_13310 [Paraburkholderia denitrificans]|uniref:Uncharacterized protein n=1 Tax=Paraburkholderia denitrificans TaxID=694025 RepID=A0ABW0J9M4_9BURK
MKLAHTLKVLVVTVGMTALGAHAADETQVLQFETHAAFFSKETGQKALLDPQVFVAQEGAPAAEGNAVLTTIAPAPLTHDNAVLVVYHSDGKSHGKLRGDIGVTAHHQLIARP